MQLLQKFCLDPFHPSTAVSLFSVLLGVLMRVGVHQAVFPDAGLASSQPAWVFRTGQTPSLLESFLELPRLLLEDSICCFKISTYDDFIDQDFACWHLQTFKPRNTVSYLFFPSFAWSVGTFYTLLTSLLPSSNSLWGVYKECSPHLQGHLSWFSVHPKEKTH